MWRLCATTTTTAVAVGRGRCQGFGGTARHVKDGVQPYHVDGSCDNPTFDENCLCPTPFSFPMPVRTHPLSTLNKVPNMTFPILAEPFASIPRTPLLFGPSPIQSLPRISLALGGKVAIYAKREDCNSGLAFGGNKIRKLEFVPFSQ